jgi:hypothetical protein
MRSSAFQTASRIVDNSIRADGLEVSAEERNSVPEREIILMPSALLSPVFVDQDLSCALRASAMGPAA